MASPQPLVTPSCSFSGTIVGGLLRRGLPSLATNPRQEALAYDVCHEYSLARRSAGVAKLK